MSTVESAVISTSTGMYRITRLTDPAQAAALPGVYIEADDMYCRGGAGRPEWVQFSGSVLVELLMDPDGEAIADVLLPSEANSRFGLNLPAGDRN